MTTPDEDIIQAAREAVLNEMSDFDRAKIGYDKTDRIIASVADALQSIRDAAKKEAAEVIAPFAARAKTWELNSDKARVSVPLGHLRAARRWMQKNGGGDAS